MSKKPRFIRPFQKQHRKQSEMLLKSERKDLYQIYWSLGMQFSSKKSVLVTCQIFGLFVNTLIANGKYSLLNRDNLLQHLQMQLSQKQKTFSAFFFFFFFFSFLHFGNLYLILNISKKRMTLIADLCLNFQNSKNRVK